MSGVRVLVGTRKGAFVLTSDGKRKKWDITGPHFAGWEMYHLKGSPADPNRLYASQSSGWFGQLIQRSNDGGKTWEPVGNKFDYEGSSRHASVVRRHAASLGIQARLASGTVAHRSGHGLCRRGRRRVVPFHRRRANLARTSRPCAAQKESCGNPGAGGMCLHTIVLDPKNPKRMLIAISAAGAFRTDDAGKTWKPINQGLKSRTSFPIPPPKSATAFTASRMHRFAARCAVHAEALGRDAQRQCRRFVARSERQFAHRFRFSD